MEAACTAPLLFGEIWLYWRNNVAYRRGCARFCYQPSPRLLELCETRTRLVRGGVVVLRSGGAEREENEAGTAAGEDVGVEEGGIGECIGAEGIGAKGSTAVHLPCSTPFVRDYVSSLPKPYAAFVVERVVAMRRTVHSFIVHSDAVSTSGTQIGNAAAEAAEATEAAEAA